MSAVRYYASEPTFCEVMMKTHWHYILAFLALSVSLKAAAFETYRLSQPLQLRVMERGVLVPLASLPTETIIEVQRHDFLGATRFEDEYGRIRRSRGGWIGVRNIELPRRPRFHSDLEYAINRFERPFRGDQFYVSEVLTQRATYLGRAGGARYSTPSRVQPRPAMDMYQVCYEQPRTQWVTMREDQARRGRRNTAVGAGAAVVGIILGGSNNSDMRNLGTALTIGGAALATVGLVQTSNARSPITVYDQTCETYYTRDTRTRTVTIGGERCVTERYYSRSWNQEVEYFQTTCQRSGNRFYSFERHSNFW